LESLPYRVRRARTGLGLFAEAPIAKGARVIEYIGPRLTDAEARQKERRGARYLFEVNTRWTIDGSSRANTARYINHSCRPNMEAVNVRGRILFQAVRRIKPGEELTFDYGRDYLDLFIPACKCAKCGEPHRHRSAKTKLKGRASF
jgi:SET domain-containing protein